jgi:hypothetical protein
VIDAATKAVLHDVVRRESRSVLTYVGDAFPWTAARDGAALERVRALIAAEGEAVAALGKYLTKQRAPVGFLGSYPSSFTTINYLSLEHLLPRLLDFETQALADLERDLAAVHDPQARALVEKLADLKRSHVAVLEELIKTTPQPASA